MDFNDAAHGPWCNSRTFPLKCRYCGEPVFYFTCSHGCKVFFDQLGTPWPEHHCREYVMAVYSKARVEQYMADQMMMRGPGIGHAIQETYARKIEQHADAPRERETLPCLPREGDGPEGVEGIVRELLPEVDLYKHFGLSRQSQVGASIVASNFKGSYAQLTVHTGALGDTDSWSFTFLIPRRLLDRAGVIKGDFVECTLRARSIPGREPVWVCEAISGAFG